MTDNNESKIDLDVTHEIYFRNRGINFKDNNEVKDYFNPDFNKILDPYDFVDMDKAVSRIKKAIDNREKILVYTDYDCDGIPGGTILYDFLTKINSNLESKIEFTNYIPHRHNEGYGLHQNVLEKFIKDGYTLMITADLGITNIKEVKYAEDNGMNVILTDHHLPIHVTRESKVGMEPEIAEDLPPAFAIINCQLKREVYINKGLCGAATAWKLVHAFLVKYRVDYNIQDGWEKWLLDMVALATIADMMSITGENRTLVHYGLKVLAKSKRPGLQKMLAIAKEKQSNINEKTIAFTIAPRINAASRLDHPMKAFALLTNNTQDGVEMAEELELINTKRKSAVGDISKLLEKALESINDDCIIFVGDEEWPIGVVGLIAQKLVEMSGKTSFVYGFDEKGVIRGSSRSHDKRVSVMDITRGASEHLLHFGGHEAAGGFALDRENLDKVKSSIMETYNNLYDSLIADKDAQSDIKQNKIYDYAFTVEDSMRDVYNKFKILAPFGIGNTQPIIKISGESSVRYFGENNKHAEINVSYNGVTYAKIVKWNIEKNVKEKIVSARNFYANIEADNWGGKNGYRFLLVDFD